MQANLAHRKRYAENNVALGNVLALPVKDIADYHAATFIDYGLDAKAWTAYVPLSPYLERGDYAGAEASRLS